MAGFPWQQQDAISDNLQDISPFPDGDVLLEPYAYVSAANSTTHRPWFELPPSTATGEAGAGGRGPGSFAGLFGVDPANLDAVTENNNCGATALDFPTSFTFASRNGPTTTTRPPAAAFSSLPIGSYSSLVSPLSTGNHDFNFASQPAATTNHAHALHDSFFHQLETPLDNLYRPPRREPLSSAQFNLNQQNDPAAILESSSLRSLIPPSQPPDLVATTTNTTTFDSPNFAPSHLSSFFPPALSRSAIQNDIASTGQPEGGLPDEVLCNNHGTGGGGGSSGSANRFTNNRRNPLQPPNMPATSSRKRTRAASYLDDLTGPSASSSKRKTHTVGRQPTNASRAPSRVILEDWPEIPDSDDLFGSDPFGEDDLKMFDLTKDDVQPGDLVVHDKPKEEEEDNRVRLAKFECIICMDSASNLTVTHCGMLSTHTCFSALGFPSFFGGDSI